MKSYVRRVLSLSAVVSFLVAAAASSRSALILLNTNLQIRFIVNTTNSTGANSVRIAKAPRNNQLRYLKINSDRFRVHLQPAGGPPTSTLRAYRAADPGRSSCR